MDEVRQVHKEHGYATAKQAQKALIYYRDVLGHSYSKIAESAPWCEIPLGTISDIYHTGKVPRKWRGLLGLKSRPRISIHKEDMNSAASTIYNNIDHDKIIELMRQLDFLLDS